METLPTDAEKLEAALEQLEAEKQRRLQAKIDAGEVVSILTTVIDEEPIEHAKARALAGRVDDGRAVHHELLFITTGVPRNPDFYAAKPDVTPITSPEPRSLGFREPVASEAETTFKASSQPETYVWVQVRQPKNQDDPGEIAEGWFSVEDGALVLVDGSHRHLARRQLKRGEVPLMLRGDCCVRWLRRHFYRRRQYPSLGLA